MTTSKRDSSPANTPPSSGVERGRWAARLQAGYEVAIDGAVGFVLVDGRSGTVIGEYADTRSLFSEIIRQVAAGFPEDALAMRVRAPSGEMEPGAEGGLLVDLATSALGIRPDRRARVAEG